MGCCLLIHGLLPVDNAQIEGLGIFVNCQLFSYNYLAFFGKKY